MIISTKYTYTENESKHSEMGSVRKTQSRDVLNCQRNCATT